MSALDSSDDSDHDEGNSSSRFLSFSFILGILNWLYHLLLLSVHLYTKYVQCTYVFNYSLSSNNNVFKELIFLLSFSQLFEILNWLDHLLLLSVYLYTKYVFNYPLSSNNNVFKELIFLLSFSQLFGILNWLDHLGSTTIKNYWKST